MLCPLKTHPKDDKISYPLSLSLSLCYVYTYYSYSVAGWRASGSAFASVSRICLSISTQRCINATEVIFDVLADVVSSRSPTRVGSWRAFSTFSCTVVAMLVIFSNSSTLSPFYIISRSFLEYSSVFSRSTRLFSNATLSIVNTRAELRTNHASRCGGGALLSDLRRIRSPPRSSGRRRGRVPCGIPIHSRA